MTVNPIDDNTAAWAAWFNGMMNAHAGEGIVSGCSISKGTGDWDIDVTSGSIFESSTESSISSGTVTITDSSGLTSGQSRVTIITADTGDALASTDGSAAADPATPDIPAGEVLLGFVVVSEGDSTAADSDIFDIPALSHAQHDAADFDGADGSDGNVLRSTGSEANWGNLDIDSPSDVSGSRALGTWEENTGSAALVVMVSVDHGTNGGGLARARGHINSSQSDNIVINWRNDGDEDAAITMIVPAGSFYKVEGATDNTINQWYEHALTTS